MDAPSPPWAGIALDADADTPLYRQLSAELRRRITSGALQPGDRLPSERQLAVQVAVSRTTAVSAYRELEALGLVRSQVGRGTFVSARPERLGAHFAWRGKVGPGVQQHLDRGIRGLVAPPPGIEIAFGAAGPALEAFPLESYLAASARALVGLGPSALGFAATEGHPRLREVIAAREGVRPEEVLVVAGTQQALDLIARCLLTPHDAVVMDWPGYLGAIQTFRLAGATLSGWDIVGADLDELEDLLLRRRPKLLYVNPSFQNPTGRTLPLEVRRGVVDLARSYRVPIVEDEPYRDLGFHGPPPPSLRDLDGEGLVLQLRTFSKSFAPGLRLGYVIADEAIVDQLALVKAQSDLFTAVPTQLAVAELLASDVFDGTLRLLRRLHRERAEAMGAALSRHFAPGDLHWRPALGGLYLWLQLRRGDSDDLRRSANRLGVDFAPGSVFFPDRSGKRTLRLCFSNHTPERIEQGVARLAEAAYRL
jgi:DNA-binding transcriptional MocR family regulator